MAKDSKFTANQRLLELIRKPAAAGAGRLGPAGPSAAEKAGVWGRGLHFFAKPVFVGVDISQAQLVCVKVRGQDAGFEVQQASIVPVPEGVEPGNKEFVALLRQTLSDLCGPGPLPRLWVAAQSSRANLQFLTIPKVASRQVDNAVFWTAKKEMAFDESGAVFDFERRGEVAEKGVERLGALAYTTPRDAVNVIKNDFLKAGYPLTGLTLEAFGHQNLFRRRIVPKSEGAVANLHVGQNWSRLEIFSNGNLMFVRVIKTSMSGMEQAVLETLQARQAAAARKAPSPAVDAGSIAGGAPTSQSESVVDLDAPESGEMDLVLELDPEPTPAAVEPHPAPAPEPAPESEVPLPPEVTLAQARELFYGIIFGCESIKQCHPGYGFDPESVMEVLEPVISRLVRQVEMTLKHFRESLGYEAVTHVTVSGLLGASRLFVTYIGEQLGLPCMVLDPMADRQSRGLAGTGLDAPGPVYTQALGLALSDPALTPNVFFTYREKAAVRSARNLEQWTLVGLATVLATMAFFSFNAVSKRQALSRDYGQLMQQMSGLAPEKDLTALVQKTQKLKARREAVRTFAVRNRGVGVWGEALALAPEGVGVGTMTVDFGPPDRSPSDGPAAKGKGDAAKAKAPLPKDVSAPMARLVLEGMITGDSRLFDALLASYVVALEGSPLFEDVSLKKSEIETRDGAAVGLRYVIALGVPEN